MTQSGKSPEGQVADAVKHNWVDRNAPAAARPYLRLSRADRPIGTWLLYIPCIWSILLASLQAGDFRAWDVWLILGCGAGAWLMRGAGCTWNDITDRKFDARWRAQDRALSHRGRSRCAARCFGCSPKRSSPFAF
jgi:4-hydroxybenzoate polyprenyltransferase